MTMKALIILATISYSATAFAQSVPPRSAKAAGSSKAERANGLQTRWNGQGYQAVAGDCVA
jgi:hypothetical protein